MKSRVYTVGLAGVLTIQRLRKRPFSTDVILCLCVGLAVGRSDLDTSSADKGKEEADTFFWRKLFGQTGFAYFDALSILVFLHSCTHRMSVSELVGIIAR